MKFDSSKSNYGKKDYIFIKIQGLFRSNLREKTKLHLHFWNALYIAPIKCPSLLRLLEAEQDFCPTLYNKPYRERYVIDEEFVIRSLGMMSVKCAMLYSPNIIKYRADNKIWYVGIFLLYLRIFPQLKIWG